MREHDDSGDNSLQDLLNQVPDKHHVETRLEGALSIITDIAPCEAREGPGLAASLNAGGRFPISADYPLKLEQKASGAAYIELPHGLSALCSRAAWYRLVDMADEAYSVLSHGARFFLG